MLLSSIVQYILVLLPGMLITTIKKPPLPHRKNTQTSKPPPWQTQRNLPLKTSATDDVALILHSSSCSNGYASVLRHRATNTVKADPQPWAKGPKERWQSHDQKRLRLFVANKLRRLGQQVWVSGEITLTTLKGFSTNYCGNRNRGCFRRRNLRRSFSATVECFLSWTWNISACSKLCFAEKLDSGVCTQIYACHSVMYVGGGRAWRDVIGVINYQVDKCQKESKLMNR